MVSRGPIVCREECMRRNGCKLDITGNCTLLQNDDFSKSCLGLNDFGVKIFRIFWFQKYVLFMGIWLTLKKISSDNFKYVISVNIEMWNVKCAIAQPHFCKWRRNVSQHALQIVPLITWKSIWISWFSTCFGFKILPLMWKNGWCWKIQISRC